MRKGLFECMDKMLDHQECLKANIQLDSYNQTMGEFGSPVTIDSPIKIKKSYKLVDVFWGFNIGVAKVCYSSP